MDVTQDSDFDNIYQDQGHWDWIRFCKVLPKFFLDNCEQTEKYQKTFNKKIVKFIIHFLVFLKVSENPYFNEIFKVSIHCQCPLDSAWG